MFFHRGIAQQLLEGLQHRLRVSVFVSGYIQNQKTQQTAGDAAIVHLCYIVRQKWENRVLHQMHCAGAVALCKQLPKLLGLLSQCIAEAAWHEPCHLLYGTLQIALNIGGGGEIIKPRELSQNSGFTHG